MIHIYKKELNYYYKGMFGYFFAAVMLFFAGIYTVMVNCMMGYANYEYTVNNMSFMFLIIIPVITMRSFAEERRQRTDKLLYSLPLSMSSIVIGKYLAMLTVLLVPSLILCFYPMALKPYGNISYGTAIANITALYMLGAAMISIGFLISTLTESQALAAGLSFVVFLFSYFAKDLADYIPGTAFASMLAVIVLSVFISGAVFLYSKNLYIAGIFLCVCICITELVYATHKASFEGLISEIVSDLSLFERFYIFARGVFDVKAIIYFLSVIVMFLYLSILSLEKRRMS